MHLYLIIVFVVGAILFTASAYFVRDRRLLMVAGAILVLVASLIVLSGGIEYSTGMQITQPVKSTTAFFLNQTFFQDDGYKAIQIVDRSQYSLDNGQEHVITDYDASVEADDFNMICTGRNRLYGVVEVTTYNEGEIRFYENPVVDANGTRCNESLSCAHVAKNRNTRRDNNVEYFEDPSLSDKGDLLSTSYVPASTENKGVGGVSGQSNWVLSPGTCYVLEFIPVSAGDAMSVRFVYNEVEKDE